MFVRHKFFVFFWQVKTNLQKSVFANISLHTKNVQLRVHIVMLDSSFAKKKNNKKFILTRIS